MFARFSVKKPLTVFVAVLMVVILGFVAFSKMTPDLLPSINLPYAIVITSYPGATPEEVEAQISKPLEQAMASLENVNDVSSVSADNMSRIMLEFSDSANMDTIVSDIREKINSVSGLWDEKVSTPYILKLNPDLLPVVVSAVKYGSMTNIELTDFMNKELLSKLEGISGVASVSVSGNVKEQIDIVLSEKKLKKVNEKIKKALDGDFADAEEELQEKIDDLQTGKDDISGQEGTLSDAKKELESGKSQLVDKTSEAQSELLSKKLEIENTKVEIKAKMADAKMLLPVLTESKKIIEDLYSSYNGAVATISELDNQIATLKELSTSYKKLVEEKESLLKQIDDIESNTEISDVTESSVDIESSKSAESSEGIESSEGTGAFGTVEIPKDNSKLDALKLELAAIEAQITAMEAGITANGSTPETIAAKVLEIEAMKLISETTIKEIESGLAAVGVTPETVESTLADMDKNIAEIEAGLVQMEGALVQLDNGSITVSDAITELNRQQINGSMQISDGLTKITVGQASLAAAKSQLDSAGGQLDSAKDDFDKQKDDAYKNANIELTMDMVNQILMAQNFSMPVGYITNGDVDYLVRVGERIHDLKELENLLIFDTGIKSVGQIRLSDVADVALNNNALDVYAKIDGNDGIMLSFSKQSTYATATVSENIAKEFKELKKEYEGMTFTNLSDQGDYIQIVIKTVLDNLIGGAILAILILLLFLKDIKPTLIIAFSIPISVLFAIVLMYFSGITLNVISLSGLAVGVGMLVDNSVVVIENIYRMRNEGASAFKAAVTGTIQVTGAIIASTLTTICVFLPIVFVEGLTRQIFVDLALTIAYSLLASLIVAITLVPAMSSNMLRRNKEKKHPVFDKMLNGYAKIASGSLNHKWIVLSAAVVLLGASVFMATREGFIFMPSMSGTQITVSVTPPDDSTFEEKRKLADDVYSRIKEQSDIETVGVMIGESSGGMMGMGGGGISAYAILKDGAKLKDAQISKNILEACSDLNAEITAQGAMDMGSYMSSMGGAGITVDIFGDNLDNLIAEAEKIGGELSKINGIEAVTTGLEDATPEIRIIVDKEKAMAKSLTTAQVYQLVAAKVKSETTSTAINIESFDKNIVIHSEKNEKTTIDTLKKMNLIVKNKKGEEEKIKLSSIAEIKKTQSLNAVNRVNQKRTIAVSATIADSYNVTKVTDTVRSTLKDYTAMDGNRVEIGGESDTIMDAVEQLMYMALLALVIIYFIMVAQFQSLKSPFIVMFTIPLAFTGGFLALLITGKELSVVSIVGFIMLAGIIVNNGIVLIDYINILRFDGMEKRDAIILAGKTRMRPILMTALTTVLGLAFMAVGTGFGSELMQPMAIVCIGGLIYGTLMTLFVIPAMYDILSPKDVKQHELE